MREGLRQIRLDYLDPFRVETFVYANAEEVIVSDIGKTDLIAKTKEELLDKIHTVALAENR